ncbi:MAG: GNAT family N-acetyltransferase [Puniceicoccales bacterium]|jgi:RimJ/RimL family protein N-acetyltransferase|nr:GNAT family N-acetyltransferase [Puniceicoccales bacterium]
MGEKFIGYVKTGASVLLFVIACGGAWKIYDSFSSISKRSKNQDYDYEQVYKVSVGKYEPNLSQEVSQALEDRKKRSRRGANSARFQGLSLAPDLGTQRLILRSIEEKDTEDFIETLSDYETVYMLTFMPWPFERNRIMDYLENLSWGMARGNAIYWAVALPGKDQFIGVIGLTLEHEHDRAELHFWLSKKYRGKGYMTEAAKRVIHYVFTELGVNRLDVNHLNINHASQRVIAKCGFRLECEKEAFAKKNGKYEDMRFYRILRREYVQAQ